MPPEPLPWDRKDFFKEKKYERSDALGSVSRWRDSHHGSREFARWGSDEFRRPPGHGKQGAYQLLSEESGHGCTPSRSSDRMVEDDFCRQSVSRAEGKYSRNSRENKGSVKGHLWDTGDASVSSFGRQHDISAQRSVDDLLTYASHPHSDIENSSLDQLHLKDHHDKMDSVHGLATGHRYNKDHSLGSMAWKPLKWTRSSSLSSRSSGFSHSSSSKSIRANLDDSKPELQPRKTTPVQSSSGDAAEGVTTLTPFEDTYSKKKQRLGWGQGLAKYEKEKVEGPEETTGRIGLIACSNSPRTSSGPVPSLADKSPRITGLSECTSPATPSSVACSSSPGMDDKHYNKVLNIENDACNLGGSPSHACQNCVEGFSVVLENLEPNKLDDLNSKFADLLQAEDASSGDSSFMKSAALNKLMLLKSDVLKALEKTECEIDLYESELKSLCSEPKKAGSSLTMSKFLQGALEPCEEADVASKEFVRPSPLQLVSSDDMLVEVPLLCDGRLDAVNAETKDEDIYSPGTASSKSVEPVSSMSQISVSDMVKHDECSMQCEAIRPLADVPHYDDAMPLSDAESVLHSSIMAFNRESARKAYEVFNNLLPSDRHPTFSVGCSNLSSEHNNLIKEKLAMKKRLLKFKERVLTLKLRAFQHLWKEDLRLLSIRKHRAKSQKRFEVSSRTSHSGSQKHRSSIRSRFTSPGNLTLVPTTEIVDFAGKLLLDSQIKICRSSLRMPALVVDEKEKRLLRFVTSNGLVEDPCAVEKERALINPWTSKEKEIFMEMLSTFGKDFKRIASFLDHKTTADCIEFYYKNHKSESFGKIKKKLEFSNQGTNIPSSMYLVTSGKKWNREVNAASLDLLGAASVIAASADISSRVPQYCGGKLFLGYDHDMPRHDDCILEGSSSIDIIGNEKEAAAADVLAGICGALSSEAMSSCVTSSVDPGDGSQEWKCQKVSSTKGRPLTPEVSHTIDDDETCSDESCEEMDSMDWTDEEKSIFIQALRLYGKDFSKISRYVSTRSKDQCRIFFSKARKCLGLDLLYSGPGNEEVPVSCTNGGRSDTEDACVVEMESAICSTQSCSRMEVDLQASVTNINSEVSGHAEPTHLQTDHDRSSEKHVTEHLDQEDSEIKVENVVPDDCWALKEPVSILGSGNNSADPDVKIDATPEVVSSEDAARVDAALSAEPSVLLSGTVAFIGDRETGGKVEIHQTVIFKEESPSVGGQKELKQSKLNAAVELPVQCGSSEEPKIDSEERQHWSEKGLNDRQEASSGAEPISSASTSCCLIPDSSVKENCLPVTATDKRVKEDLISPATYQHQISLELLTSMQKPQAISWQQKENCPVSVGLDLPDSSVHYEKSRRGASSSALDLEVHDDKQQQKSATTDIYQQYMLSHNSLNRVDPVQILRGYPLQVLNKKEINGNAETKSSEKSAIVQNFSKMDRNSHCNQYLVQDLYNEKCTSSRFPHSVAELPLLPKSLEQSSIDHTRSHSLNGSETEEQSRRTGDVKLFGQILSHPSVPKPNPTSPENNEKGTSCKPSSNSLNFKFAPNHGIDGNAVTLKLDPNNHSGLEDIPTRSYGFWDGNRIQTGLSSLPDSAILLSKYPAAFIDYATSSCRMEKQPLPAVAKRNDRNMGCVSVFPTKDVNGTGGLTDYQVYRSYDGMKLQPFTVDVQRHDILTELQKRNGLDGLSSFQHQGRGAVGMNVVGGGILVGGSCTGVSDPVAAIKMHYATSERYGGQSGSTRDDKSWHGGDIGR
ncbi:PREDICTED: uncharacterized protein LOC104602664 isoform X2 [Nelumbo nucifera]|uniref:Uncharacterized protein LOC104602664 isoform X2 n=2 Tax=Nelumbo nucifera TaxID=4432 RepID=A0A1U8AQ17_NELNU|nr:PREDICTED: uncharacterized protein LOC104602664 isoform X2 [Nelumbo nucifera]DAD27947.1 TPA_asm: hypothetical protein HUJ06_029415 [Nelumbo nucifera]